MEDTIKQTINIITYDDMLPIVLQLIFAFMGLLTRNQTTSKGTKTKDNPSVMIMNYSRNSLIA